jgi:hypothetical protein
MATDTKPRTPGTTIPQAPRAPRGPGSRGSGGNDFPPAGGSPGGRPQGKATPPGETKKITSPRHTRPNAGPRPNQGPDRPVQQQQQRPRQQRMPFILLLVGLLGGALISLLVISTTLDEGSYDINNLTSQNNMLYKDEQALINQVNQEKNPAVIASEAAGLGLRTQKDERFINPSTGAVIVAPAVTPEP